MSTRNTDASLITKIRQAKALYAYNTELQQAQNNNATTRQEQTNTQTLDVVTLRKQGGCYCSPTANVYDFSGGACGCGPR
jgi:hypothetical protein